MKSKKALTTEDLDRLMARGVWTISVPEAGLMVGCGEYASYEAAKRGQIPVAEFGRFKRVPILAWKRKLETPA